MNLTRLSPLVFVLALTALAQTSERRFSSDILRGNCPIELKASLRIAGNITPITPVERGQRVGDNEQLEITLSNPKSDVLRARVTIYGFPVGERVDPAVLYSPHNPAEIKKAASLDRTVEAGRSTSYEISIPNFSTVTSIELDSVAYLDGTSWRPAARGSCRALPLPIDTAMANPR